MRLVTLAVARYPTLQVKQTKVAAAPSGTAATIVFCVRRSELGRQVAVDFEADADFDKRRSGPGHGVLLEAGASARCEPTPESTLWFGPVQQGAERGRGPSRRCVHFRREGPL